MELAGGIYFEPRYPFFMLQEYGGCEDQEGDVGEEEEKVPSEPWQCLTGSV